MFNNYFYYCLSCWKPILIDRKGDVLKDKSFLKIHRKVSVMEDF